MSSDKKVVPIDQRAKDAAAALATDSSLPSEDRIALEVIDAHCNHWRYVPQWNSWLEWTGQRFQREPTGKFFDLIRREIRKRVAGTKAERTTASAPFVGGVERLARTDQRIVVVPDQLDADPWLLNTQSGIVNLLTGDIAPHDPDALMTRITGARVDANEGRELWTQFLQDVTMGDVEQMAYLQRMAGYCATGDISEDVIFFIYGPGGNGKNSFSEALEAALGDYAMVFAPEVLMESGGERHPTELAQFVGMRAAISSEPSVSAIWNDARVKSLTGDATINARVMRGDPFTFRRTHKTIVIGNHMPRLNAVTHAIRRRVQMIPFRAVFPQSVGPGMRERLKSEAGGAVLAWIIAGAAQWRAHGTSPPAAVRKLTDEYLQGQDDLAEWLDEACERVADGSETSAALYRSYTAWCERNGCRAKSNKLLSMALIEAGFEKRHTMIGKTFYGLMLRAA